MLNKTKKEILKILTIFILILFSLSISVLVAIVDQLEQRADDVINRGNAFLDSMGTLSKLTSTTGGKIGLSIVGVLIALALLFIIMRVRNKLAHSDRQKVTGRRINDILSEIERLLLKARHRLLAINNRMPRQLLTNSPQFQPDREALARAISEMRVDPEVTAGAVRSAPFSIWKRFRNREKNIRRQIESVNFCRTTTPSYTAPEKKDLADDIVACVDAFVKAQFLIRHRLTGLFRANYVALKKLEEKIESMKNISGFDDGNQTGIFILDQNNRELRRVLTPALTSVQVLIVDQTGTQVAQTMLTGPNTHNRWTGSINTLAPGTYFYRFILNPATHNIPLSDPFNLNRTTIATIEYSVIIIN